MKVKTQKQIKRKQNAKLITMYMIVMSFIASMDALVNINWILITLIFLAVNATIIQLYMSIQHDEKKIKANIISQNKMAAYRGNRNEIFCFI